MPGLRGRLDRVGLLEALGQPGLQVTEVIKDQQGRPERQVNSVTHVNEREV